MFLINECVFGQKEISGSRQCVAELDGDNLAMLKRGDNSLMGRCFWVFVVCST
jgi:hypothetical protein